MGRTKDMCAATVRRLRQGMRMPPLPSRANAGSWRDQLEARLVAVNEVDINTASMVGDIDWLRCWTNELTAFIPGFQLTPHAIEVDRQGEESANDMDRELERLLEAEESERAWRLQQEQEEQEERERQERYEQMCAEEAAHLQREAGLYRSEEEDQLRRAMDSGEPATAKKRCVLSLEASSGSSDAPRVVHSLALDIPRNGGAVTVVIRATMEPHPENVSTQRASARAFA